MTTALTAPAAGSATTAPPARPRGLLLHQLRYEVRAAGRNTVLLGFTLAMPLAFLGIFGTLLGGETVGPAAVAYQSFFVPNVVVLGLLSTCFASLGIALALRRATGELKRVRGTPAPPSVVLAALALETAGLGIVVSAAVVATGRLWWDVSLPSPVPFAVVVLVAAPSLAALGVAVATFIRRAENGPAATNLLLWPVAFISGSFTWVPPGSPLDRIAQLLPVRHLNQAMRSAFGDRPSINLAALAAIAAWGAIGAAIAIARFRWEPRA